MYRLIATVKPFRAAAVIQALAALPVIEGEVREVMGYGRQKNRLRRYLGSEFNATYLPKVEITVFVADDDREAAERAMIAAARTGRIGDGKIVVQRCLDLHAAW